MTRSRRRASPTYPPRPTPPRPLPVALLGSGEHAGASNFSNSFLLLFKLSEEGEEEELQMVQRQRLQSLSLHHRIGDRSGAAGLAATLQMMAGVGDGA